MGFFVAPLAPGGSRGSPHRTRASPSRGLHPTEGDHHDSDPQTTPGRGFLAHSGQPRRHRLQPACQALEDRTLLSLLQSVTDYGGLGGIQAVAVGDFNHDGNADVVAASNNSVALLLGRGDGTFGSYTLFPIGPSLDLGQNPAAIAVGDFNRAGNLDVVTANYASGNVSVLLGNGNGSFQPAENFAVGTLPGGISSAGLGGRRRPHRQRHPRHRDREFGDDTVSVLLGDGTARSDRPSRSPPAASRTRWPSPTSRTTASPIWSSLTGGVGP